MAFKFFYMYENRSIDMTSMKKKGLLLSAVLSFSVFFIALCPQLCPPAYHGVGFTQAANCLFSATIGSGLLALLTLSLIGSLILVNVTSIPEGIVLPPFRPPRFHF
jgi:hypothetical protein